MPQKNKIPVLIVTGFLGSGKTTFINNLLAQNQTVKVGLIENEFGEAAIDPRLILNYKPESIVELTNGCICCSIFNEFSLALQELVKKHDHLEMLVIETTGIADPGPVISPFYQDADLIRLFDLAGTVCLVDAVNFGQYDHEALPQKQIILSDLIILNKIGEASPAQVIAARKKIISLNQTARLEEANFARIDLMQSYMLQALIQEDFIRKLRKPFYSEPESGEYHSFTIRFAGKLNQEQFTEWFRYFASLHNKEIFRIKGVIQFEDNPITTIVQSVGGMIRMTEGSVINPFENQENILVFIGKEVSKFEIEKEIGLFLTQNNQP